MDTIKKDIFGSVKDHYTGKEVPVFRYTLSTSKGVIVKLISLGATMNSVEVPDKNNKLDHIILGFDSVEDYMKYNYIGSTIGRFGNRIKHGKFHLDGEDFQLPINNNDNHLHGGKPGWDKAVWKSSVKGKKVTFTHLSPDGDQGYPGDVMAQVTYCLEEDGCLKVDYQAMSSKATPINMTNHSFFNLCGHASGQTGIFEHEYQVFADGYLPVSSDLIPTGVVEPVDGSPFDLRQKIPIKDSLAKAPNHGFDHSFCFTDKKRGELKLVAAFDHPPSGRSLEVFTTELAAQIYTGNFMPQEEGKMVGRGGVSYKYQGAFCCEPQNYPDAVNQNFPNAIIRPGELYKHSFIYKFTTN